MPVIIDVHSHVWKFPEHFTEDFRNQASQRAKADEELDLTSTHEGYEATVPDGE